MEKMKVFGIFEILLGIFSYIVFSNLECPATNIGEVISVMPSFSFYEGLIFLFVSLVLIFQGIINLRKK